MNGLTIGILVIIIVLCLYYVIEYFNPAEIIGKSKPLKAENKESILSFDTTKFDSPGSSRYYYEAWIFIDSNFPADSNNVIWNRGTDFVLTLNGTKLTIYVNGKDTANYNTTNGVFTYTNVSDRVKLMEITAAFPFQKWTYLVINVDGLNVDAYIDGKLVKSVQSKVVLATGSAALTVGNKFTQGRIAKLRRPNSSINPQNVWNRYMLGNGENTSLSPYHINVQLLKNGQIRNDNRIF